MKPGRESQFESAFEKRLQSFLESMGIEATNFNAVSNIRIATSCSSVGIRLKINTVGFRQSSEYQQWKSLLHHFYDPFPIVEHYESVFAGGEEA